MNPNQQNSLNMIPPSFGQSRIPNLETLYTNAAAAQVAAPQIGSFNFGHHASPATNPYFLANILSQQPSIINHHSAMLAGGSDHSLNQQISSPMINRHQQVQMYDNFIYHQQQQQQHNHMLAASSAAASFSNYNAEAKRFAAAAQYSQILPPFFAAANSTTNMMLANALLVNSYGDVGRNNIAAQSSSTGKDSLNISEHSIMDATAVKQTLKNIPNSNNDTVYLPSPASNKSSMSACDAKSLDRSPFAHPCGPGSHQDLNVNSPSTMSAQRTPSNLSFQSPAAAITDRSPVGAAVISPSLINLGLVPQSPACAINPRMSLSHTNMPSSSNSNQTALFQQYVIDTNPKLLQSMNNSAPDFLQSRAQQANNLIIASAALSSEQQKSHFYSQDRNNNSTISNSLSTVTQEDPFSVLTKDVNLDLEALAGPSNVTQQFWDDLGDSVLDDALLSSSATQEEAGAVGQSLLHSVFEFPSLQSVAPFDDIVTSMENSIRSFDLVDEHSSHMLDAEPCGSQASAIVQQNVDNHCWMKNEVNLTTTCKNKNSHTKENELAEIDREFARHFNAIVQKDAIQIVTPQEIKLPVKVDILTADLDFCTSRRPSTIALSLESSSAEKTAFSPICFDSSEKEDLNDGDDTLMNRFPHLGKYFGPLSPKIRASSNVFGDGILQSAASEVEPQSDTSASSAKWAPRKSKRVPIYKQQTQKSRQQNAEANMHTTSQTIATPPTVARVMSCDTKRLSLKVSLRSAPLSMKASETPGGGQQHDSPYSFTEEDDEQDSSAEQPSTSSAVALKQEVPDKFTSGVTVRERKAGMVTRRQKSSNLTATGSVHSGGNSKPSVDEKLVEEEVKRKLMQISSLHPELRLAISSCSNKTDISGGKVEGAAPCDDFGKEDAMQRVFTQPLLVTDPLRHVVPKKRLSTRQNSLTPPLTLQGPSATPIFLPPRNSSADAVESSSNFSPQVPFPQPFVCTRVISDTETAKPANLVSSKSTVAAALTPEIKPLKLTIVKSEPLPSAPTPEPLKPKLILRIPKRCLSTENDVSESRTSKMRDDENAEDDLTKIKKHKHKKKKKREKERCDILDNIGVQATMSDRALTLVDGPSTSSQGNSIQEAEFEQDYGDATTSKRTINDSKYHQTIVLNKNRKKMRWLQASEDDAFNNNDQFATHPSGEPHNDLYNSTIAEQSLLDSSNVNGSKVLDHTPIFLKGAFVVYKSDLSKPDCPIWRVDSQNLLQKFLPADQDGRTIYVGSSTYAGWCLQNQELFAAVQVKNLHQTKQETTVQLEYPITDLFPAISFEISDGVDRSVPSYSITESNSNISFELDHPLKEALQTYVHILIVHSILGNYMQILKLRNETTLLTKMSEVDNLNNEKKRRLTKDACWSPKFEDALEWYPYCTVNEDDGSGLHCQACGKNIVENVLQLFANEGYDFDTLLPRQPKTTISGSPIPSQDFHVCPSCADIAVLYHKLTHMRYHLYKQCLDKVDLIRGDNTDMEPALIIENCLIQNSWIVGSLQEYVGIWSKIS